MAYGQYTATKKTNDHMHTHIIIHTAQTFAPPNAFRARQHKQTSNVSSKQSMAYKSANDEDTNTDTYRSVTHRDQLYVPVQQQGKGMNEESE